MIGNTQRPHRQAGKVKETANSSIPLAHRVTCTVAEACDGTGIGRTKLYELMAEGRLDSTMIGRRRLILMGSLLKLLEPPKR
jgi:excisionase family DNA binding protein